MNERAEFETQLLEMLPKLRAYAFARLRDRGKADDMVNQAAVQALAAWTQFQPGTSFKNWMYRIINNVMLSEFRRHKRKEALSLDDDEHPVHIAQAPMQDVLMDEASVRRALQLLPVQYRHVLMRICVDGWSYEETAKEIDVDIGTIKSRLWRARESMKRMLVM